MPPFVMGGEVFLPGALPHHAPLGRLHEFLKQAGMPPSQLRRQQLFKGLIQQLGHGVTEDIGAI